eukprot:4461065-Pleurochrysis_carterae.AAC.1
MAKVGTTPTPGRLCVGVLCPCMIPRKPERTVCFSLFVKAPSFLNDTRKLHSTVDAEKGADRSKIGQLSDDVARYLVRPQAPFQSRNRLRAHRPEIVASKVIFGVRKRMPYAEQPLMPKSLCCQQQ